MSGTSSPPDGDSRAGHARRVRALLTTALAGSGTAWSLGSFGAVAVFSRGADEAWELLDDARLGLVTARGGVALTPPPDLRPVAHETAIGDTWNHAVALCLPEGSCAMAGRGTVTELGPDREAAKPEDRGSILFDLGLGLRAVDACVRTADPEVLACLRAGAGLPLFGSGNPVAPRLAALSPHRVFRTRVGRIEVFAPVPAPGEASPEGPHSHIVPQILRAGRTHAATTPIPAGHVPCGAIHPPHPCKDAPDRPIPFDRARHTAFQALMDAWAEPDLLAVKRAALNDAARPPDGPRRRHAENARRVAVLQGHRLRGEASEDSAERGNA